MNLKRVAGWIYEYKLRILEGGCLFVGVTLGLIASGIVVYERHASTGAYRQEYAGRLIEKQTRSFETREGSFMERYLIIEEKTGRRIQVVVSEDVFETVKEGGWIQRTSRGVEMFAEEPKENVSP